MIKITPDTLLLQSKIICFCRFSEYLYNFTGIKKGKNTMKKTLVCVFGFIICLMVTAVAFAAPVPDTGQSKCYNATVEIPCPSPGQPFYGQDAQYTINPMSYTKLDGSGNALPDSAASWIMVKDNVTGLIWENKTDDGTIHDKDNDFTWYDPTDPDPGTPGKDTDTKDFIDALNSAHFGGYSDWRMPTIKELGTIVKYEISGSGAKIDTIYFPYTQARFYWSATTYARAMFFSVHAWGVDFSSYYENTRDKSNFNYVRAVRGEQSIAAGVYTDNGDGTVTDTFTGLMWQQNAPLYSKKTWEEALSYCENLPLAGYTDWRVPTQKELLSLADFSQRKNPAINITYFPDTFSSYYWSSTTYTGTSLFSNLKDSAWRVDFADGGGGTSYKTDSDYVRAVRGVQFGSLAASFVGSGLWIYNSGVAAWSQISSTNPENMIYSGSVLYVDFGTPYFGTSYGLCKWDGTAWTQLTAANPENMVTSSSTLYVDFGASNGLYKWDGSAWSQLTSANPENMVVSGSTLYVDFAALGLYVRPGKVACFSGCESRPGRYVKPATG
jgi:hypothetical protein